MTNPQTRWDSAPASQLGALVRTELGGEVSEAVHAATRARLLGALADGLPRPPAAPAVGGWGGVRGAGLLLAAAAVVALAFGAGYSVGVRRAEVVRVAAERVPEPSAAGAVLPPPPSAAPSAVSSVVAREAPPPEPLPTLRQLLEQGEAPRVIERVERMGVDACLARCSASDLEALADAARFTGRNDLGARVLPAQRRRFPGTDAAATAAFLLGRTAQAAGRDAEAQRWFETYLRERPGGALAGEALGRAMQVADRSGNGSRARSFAEAYLRAAPTGSYATQARAVLSNR